MTEDVDFIIENRLQRLEVWAEIGRRSGLSADEIKRSADLYAAAVLVPVCGYAVQRLGTIGFEPDGFMLQSGTFQFAARQDLKRALVTGWLPEQHGKEIDIKVACAGRSFTRRCAPGAFFSLELPLEIVRDTEHQFRIALSASYQPAAVSSDSSDTRNLGCLIHSVEFS